MEAEGQNVDPEYIDPKDAQKFINQTRRGLRPSAGGRYIEFTEKVRMITENRADVLKQLETLKKRREEQGYNAWNQPVVFFAQVSRHGFSKGPKEGWYVEVRPFKIKNGQSHVTALRRLENLNKLIVGYDLPTSEEYQKKAAAALQAGATNPQAISANDPDVIKRYADMHKYCIAQCKRTIGDWAKTDRIEELEQQLEKRESELEKRLKAREQALEAAEAVDPETPEETEQEPEADETEQEPEKEQGEDS